MKRILCLDAVGGAAGDMILAALLDVGVDADAVERVLRGLGLEGWKMTVQPTVRSSVAATHVRFEPDHVQALPRTPASHSHDHGHGHGHDHDHDHGHPGSPPHRGTPEQDAAHRPGEEPHFPGQPDRSWSVIRALLRDASLPEPVRAAATAIFQRLAEAEARVHACTPDAVHFHEVGGVDAILDIVGCAAAIHLLGVDEIIAGPLPVGRGWVRCAHGRIPLPAPATLTLMQGWNTEPGVDRVEQVTPTGAAIWTTLGRQASLPRMTIEATGYGAGSRCLADRPNVVRAVLATVPTEAKTGPSQQEVEVTAAQIDDMSPEHLAPLFEALFAAGALDATATPVHMKKGRVGLKVEALSLAGSGDDVAEAFLRHSTTFGVRRWTTQRTILDRWHESVETPWGAVRIKVGARRGEVLQAAPEYDDVVAVARSATVSTLRVHAAAVAAWTHRGPPTDD